MINKRVIYMYWGTIYLYLLFIITIVIQDYIESISGNSSYIICINSYIFYTAFCLTLLILSDLAISFIKIKIEERLK